jgi:alkylated DNA nucleotide flippase Atl1
MPGGELVQRFLLEDEGVEFNAGGRTLLARYRWDGGS